MSLSLERLQRHSPGMCRVGLSATVAPLDEVAKYLVGPKRKCKIIDVQYLKNMHLEVISPVDDLVNTSYEETTKKRLVEKVNRLLHYKTICKTGKVNNLICKDLEKIIYRRL